MAKYIYLDGVNPMTLVFLRNALALPVLAFLTLRQQKSLRISVATLPSILIMALLGCCITPILLFSSYSHISSGTATVFHFIYPAIVVIGGFFLSKGKANFRNLICVGVCMVGLLLFYEPGESLNWKGSLLAISSGFTFAAYVLLLGNFKAAGTLGYSFTFYTILFSSICMALICLVTGQFAFPQTLGGWGLCLLFALLVSAVAVVLFQQGTLLIGGQRTSILSTLEPITSVFVGIFVFRETVNLRTGIGTFLILLASILIAVFDAKNKKKAE